MYHLTQPSQIDSLFALGEYLRDVREGQRMTIEETARTLHIRAVYLKALESGDWSELPGQAYGRGYLRQYASHIGLSPDEIMLVLEKIQGKINSRLHYFETESTEQAPARHTVWLSLAAVMILLIGWHFLQDENIEDIAEDYTIPQEFTAAFTEQSTVTESPYPIAAQECLKLMQQVEHPCYWKQPLSSLPILAEKPEFFVYD